MGAKLDINILKKQEINTNFLPKYKQIIKALNTKTTKEERLNCATSHPYYSI
jgi:hypothetical protein